MDDPEDKRAEDYINRGLRVAISAVPVLGGPLLELFTFAVAEPAQERRDDFLKSIFQRVMDLEKKHEAFKPENLRANEAFQATCIQVVQVGLRTADSKKRDALRNAALNSAIMVDLEETRRQMFMNFLDRITPMHVALLKFFDKPTANPNVAKRLENLMAGGLATVVEVAIPQLKEADRFADILVGDLEQMSLLHGAGLRVTMTAQGMAAQRTTPLGRRFLAFISDPETGEAPVG